MMNAIFKFNLFGFTKFRVGYIKKKYERSLAKKNGNRRKMVQLFNDRAIIEPVVDDLIGWCIDDFVPFSFTEAFFEHQLFQNSKII